MLETTAILILNDNFLTKTIIDDQKEKLVDHGESKH